MASPAQSRSHSRPVPSPSNPVLLATQAQWLFTDEELTRTPSQLDGMKFEAEHTSRSKGVNFITQVGIMLKLPQLTIATAAVFLHRFFMRFSMVDLPSRRGMHPYAIAATSLFLATKVEENTRRMRELVVACCRVGQKQPNLLVDEQSKEFWKWRDTILHNEDLLLEALCFDLQLEQPYRLLYDFICFFGLNENKFLRNASWAFVNDSMFTVLCLQFPARTIAAAALYAAARHCDISIEDDDLGRPWWEQINVNLSEVRRACSRLAQLYENNSLQKHHHHYPTTPVASDEGAEKTRRPRSSTPAVTSTGPPTPSGPPHEADVNSRKRSREPEEPAAPSKSENPPPLNGQRSPKRQRLSPHDSMESKSTAADTPVTQPSTSKSFASHGATATSDVPSSHDRYMNGHVPPPASHSRHSHPLPRVPQQYQHDRPFPRKNSHDKPPNHIDPVQQRIDQIVHHNASHKDGYKDASFDQRDSADHYRPRDPYRERRPSPSASRPSRKPSLDGKERPPDPPSRDNVPPPPPPPPPPAQEPEEEEAGGSEEGELV
ncbi:Cyclin protein-domain protein [Aspergillus sclerotialis]|uniref:RNA polymerase II holoenzyme cyclin-like subunit n=1 Tax=Aspergillus sclerotialis TaxID=2070753 RepID=A0A3A2ZGC9_9EURO|nr:Cyclin protein-domain protein [Aspergillus sclerotialis]